MAIGERIRWFRKRLGLTQKELGIKIGLNTVTAETRIGQYETGQRKPKPDMIKDDEMILLARDICRKIEEEVEYPGQIKVNIIRESRAVEYAK